jgi:predicted porin
MNKQPTRIALAVAGVCASLCVGNAVAFEVGSKDGWKLDVNGTVNAFYVNSDNETTVAGVKTDNKQANVQNGLLPGWINFVATGQQDGFDIKAHFGFAPGINSNSPTVGLPTAVNGVNTDAYSKIDSRNVYFQFGNASMGTLKFGRDIGLFGQTVILNDMTLLGVGGTTRAAEPFNTSFGMIGHGYMYTGFQPQITYSAPAMGGLNISAGIFNPSQATGNERKSPAFQAHAAYDWKGGKVWASTVSQKTTGTGGISSSGFEGGVKMGFGPFEALAYAFTAKGLGISTVGAQFIGGLDAAGNRLESKGMFVQGTFKATDKLKVGLSYGKNTDTDLLAVGTDTENKAVAAGAYYSLTKSITLVGEYVNEKGDNLVTVGNNSTSKTNTLSLGAILFF